MNREPKRSPLRSGLCEEARVPKSRGSKGREEALERRGRFEHRVEVRDQQHPRGAALALMPREQVPEAACAAISAVVADLQKPATSSYFTISDLEFEIGIESPRQAW